MFLPERVHVTLHDDVWILGQQRIVGQDLRSEAKEANAATRQFMALFVSCRDAAVFGMYHLAVIVYLSLVELRAIVLYVQTTSYS